MGLVTPRRRSVLRLPARLTLGDSMSMNEDDEIAATPIRTTFGAVLDECFQVAYSVESAIAEVLEIKDRKTRDLVHRAALKATGKWSEDFARRLQPDPALDHDRQGDTP